ncbi:MAG: 2-dehydropantoate 2-reductase [candidate division NC10 bacterium]|nr:2-dehydropantoate 2-reductase [candidate division NC10 bacterium]
MRTVAVMGAGAVGGYFGGLLARSGVDVSFIARGRHLEALKRKGLIVKSVHGDFSLPVEATSDPRVVGPVDLLLFCVKSYDTEQAIRQALPMVGPSTLVLSLQNGVDNGEKLATVVGKEKVLVAAVSVDSGVPEPGVIAHMGEGRIVFGEPDGGLSERAKWLEVFLNQHDVPAQASEDVRRPQWSKFVWNAAFNPINAIIGGPVRRIVQHPLTLELARRTMEEVVQIAEAFGILLPNDLIERHLGSTETIGLEVKTSTLQDLEAGKPLEAEALSGTVVRKGQALGIPTPYSLSLYALLASLQRTPA